MDTTETPVGLALSAGAVGVDAIALILPAGAGREVAKFVAAALRLGADLADAGHDPAVVIERMHDETPLLADVEAHWKARIARKSTP